MAKSKDQFQGRVGNMVFYKVGDTTRIRSATFMFRDRNSPKQQAVRKRFTVALRFYQRIQEVNLSGSWKLAAQNMVMSGYNLFMQQNIHVFNDCTLHDPQKLLLTTGTLPPMNHLEITHREGSKVTLEWENSLNMEGMRASDRLQVVALFGNRIFTPVRIQGVMAFRRNRKVTIDLGENEKREVHLYCFFVSPADHTYSPSYYVCTTLNPNL